MALARPALLTLLALAACQVPSDYEGTPFEPKQPDPLADDADLGRYLSLDISPDGTQLVMAAYEKTLNGLLFGVGTPQADGTVTWLYEQVDGYNEGGLDPGDRGQYASMKVAPDGTVWIASWDATTKQLRYAHRAAGGPATQSDRSWKIGVIDAGPNVGTWASLDIDGDGKPVVAYRDDASRALKVAHLTGDLEADPLVWTVTTVDEGNAFPGSDTEEARQADVGTYARLMIEGGTEFIAYYDAGQRRLALAEGQGGNYSTSFVSEPGVDAGQWPSMLWDNGVLHVAYQDVTNQHLLVSTRSGGSWTTELADDKPLTGADTEIVKRGGKVEVVYFDGQNNDMKSAKKSGNSWVPDTLAGDGVPVGFYNEIVRLGERWWVGCYDFSTKRPLYKLLPETSATP